MSNTGTVEPTPQSLILVQEPAFLGVVWACLGLTFCFVAFRIYVRLHVYRKLFDDDYLVILAWLILLTCNILWHVRKTLDIVYLSFYVGYGAEAPTPYYIEHLVNWLRILFAELFLNMIGLWCIKFSFLAFFRRLGHNVSGQKILWWSVTICTVAALAISIGATYYPCIFATFEFETTFCPKPEAGVAIYRSYRIQFGCDFATDLLILLIPAKLLWKVQISLRQKLGLFAMFFLTAITMVFSLVRVVVGLRGPREDDVWFFLCATIELTIAIIIACLVSYRALSNKEKRRPSNKYKTYATSQHFPKDRTNQSDPYSAATTVHQKEGPRSESGSTMHDGVEVVPLDMIHIQR